MMQKKLFSGMLWVLALNLLIKPFWILGIEVGVQNAVGAAEYGFYIELYNIAYIFNILLDLGVTNFNTRNIARHPHLIEKHLSGMLAIKLLLLALYGVVTLSVGLLIGFDSRQFWMLAVLSFNQFLNSLILYLRSNFEGLLLFRWDSIISILDRVVMILICGGLLWLPRHPAFRIEYFVYAQTVAYLSTALGALMVLLRKTTARRSGRPFALRFSWPFMWVIVKKSAPFALLVLLMASYNRIDPILIAHLLPEGAKEAGVYSSAFRLLDALTMVAYLVSIPLLPVFSKLTHCADAGDELADSIRITTSLMTLFSVTAAVTCATMSHQLMDLFYVEHVEESAHVFAVLIYGIIPISVTYIFGTLLTAGGYLRRLNCLAACTLVINVGINLWLIPSLGVTGAAWASLSAQSFMAVTQLGVALRTYHLRPQVGYLARIAAFVLLEVALNMWMPLVVWWQRVLLSLAAAGTLALLLRLLDVRKLVEVLRSDEGEEE